MYVSSNWLLMIVSFVIQMHCERVWWRHLSSRSVTIFDVYSDEHCMIQCHSSLVCIYNPPDAPSLISCFIGSVSDTRVPADTIFNCSIRPIIVSQVSFLVIIQTHHIHVYNNCQCIDDRCFLQSMWAMSVSRRSSIRIIIQLILVVE